MNIPDFDLGYWFESRPGDRFTVIGVLDPDPSVLVSPGWMFIRYPHNYAAKDSAVSLVGLSYTRIETNTGAGWTSLGPTDEFLPGVGYWVFFTGSGIWDP